jgi:hypothetical protein
VVCAPCSHAPLSPTAHHAEVQDQSTSVQTAMAESAPCRNQHSNKVSLTRHCTAEPHNAQRM